MTQEDSQMAQARLASALTLDDAARIVGIDRIAYERAEEHPAALTLGELRTLAREFNADGRAIMRTWLADYLGL